MTSIVKVAFFTLTISSLASAQFLPHRDFPTGGFPPFPQAVAVADLNGDKLPDLVTANGGANSVSVLLGINGGTFQPHIDYAVGSYAWGVAIGDLNEDGVPDVVASNEFDSTVSVLLGRGDGTFQLASNYRAASTTVASVVIVDLNLDGHSDVIVSTNTGVSVLLGNGDGTLQSFMGYSGLSESLGIAIGDFNLDGKPDVAATNVNIGVSVFLGNGDGTLQHHKDFATDPNGAPVGVAVADFNLDGNPDLAVASQQSSDISVLLGNGDGTFKGFVPYSTANLPYSVTVADFNHDGNPDLVVPNGFINTVSVLQGNGDGTFQSHVDYGTGIFPASIVAPDVNGDTLPDIVTANAGNASVSVLLQTGGTFVATRSSSDPSTFGQPVTFTTSVKSSVPDSGNPTGIVTFSDGAILLATVPLANGQASFTTSSLNIGVHAIGARYSGNVSFKPHKGNPIAQKVLRE